MSSKRNEEIFDNIQLVHKKIESSSSSKSTETIDSKLCNEKYVVHESGNESTSNKSDDNNTTETSKDEVSGTIIETQESTDLTNSTQKLVPKSFDLPLVANKRKRRNAIYPKSEEADIANEFAMNYKMENVVIVNPNDIDNDTDSDKDDSPDQRKRSRK